MMNSSLRNTLGLLVGAVALVGCAASSLHRKGLDDIERGNYETGVTELASAVEKAPDNMTFKLDLAARREASIEKLITIADGYRAAGQFDAALTTYRRVLNINSTEQRALHGIEGVDADRRHLAQVAEASKDFDKKDYDAADAILRTVLTEDAGFGPATALENKINLARGPTTVAPRLKAKNNAKVTLQFRDAPTKMVFEVLARQTGINFILDKDVKSDTKTTIFVQEVPIEEAIDLVLDQNALARQILSSNMVLIYPNTPAKQKDYEEQIVHTFYLTNAAPKDVESLLKSMLGAKTLFVDERTSVVVMRDTPDAVRMAEKLVASIDVPEPEVLIEVEVLEIARSRLLNLGMTLPGSFTASATSVAGAAATGATTATTGGSSLLLSDISKQTANTIQVSSLSATVNALQTVGNTNTLASPRIRARNKEKAKILIGSRVPVITSSTALLTSGTASSSSVQYLDVGLTLEVQPTVYQDGDVSIKVGLEVSSITNTVQVAGTQAYTIGTRNANTLLRLKDGETQILAGLIQDSDTRSSAGIPGFSQIPIIGRLFGSNSTDREKSEIVLSITPRIIRTQAHPASDNTEFWYGTETRARSSPFIGGGDNAAPTGGGSASGGSSAPSGPGIPTQGPRPSVSQPVIPGAPVPAPAPPPAAAPAGPPPHPTVSIDGPAEIKVGDEFDITVRMASDIGITKLRSQVRFDTSAMQLISATAGELVPASAGSPTVDAKAGGAQMDVTSPEDPVAGEGSLMLLRFKALAARPASAIAAQVSAMGPAGGAMANAASKPLSIAIKP